MAGPSPVAVGGPGIDCSGRPRNKWTGIFMTTFAAFGGILFGYDTGVISGIKMMPDWLQTFGHKTDIGWDVSTATESAVVGVLSAGTFVGALLAAPVADVTGRRTGILIACFLFSLGVVLQTAASCVALFLVGRIFSGLGVGLVSVIVPLYQSECAPKWIRGAVVSCYQLFVTIGFLFAAIINKSTQGRADHSSWRIPVALQFLWVAVLASGTAALPESPCFLIKKGSEDDAAKALGRLVSASPMDPVVGQELDRIRDYLNLEQEVNQASYLDCFRWTSNRILFRTLTGMFILVGQQLTGITFIYYYGTTFFARSGVTDPFLASIIVNLVNVIMTIPGIWLVDRAGRRILLLIGAFGMLISQYIIAIVGVSVRKQHPASQVVLVTFVTFYIAFFAATWGPIPWVVTSEIFPLSVRAKAMSMSTANYWLWNTIIAFAIPYVVNPGPGNANLGVKVFFIWGTACFVCLVFAYLCIPETKGLSLEAIDDLYRTTTPVHSSTYQHETRADEQTLGTEGNKGGKDDSDAESGETEPTEKGDAF